MPQLRDQKYVLQKMPWAREKGVDPEPHDCRLNHAGSAKEMGKEGKGLWSKLGGGGVVRLAMHDSKNCLKLLTCLWQSSCEGLGDATLSLHCC